MFDVEMTGWMIEQVASQGVFRLHRGGQDYYVHLACFHIEQVSSKEGWHRLRFTIRPEDQWARLVYWRLCNG